MGGYVDKCSYNGMFVNLCNRFMPLMPRSIYINVLWKINTSPTEVQLRQENLNFISRTKLARETSYIYIYIYIYYITINQIVSKVICALRNCKYIYSSVIIPINIFKTYIKSANRLQIFLSKIFQSYFLFTVPIETFLRCTKNMQLFE